MTTVIRTRDAGYPRYVRDVTLNNSDRIVYTVPTGKIAKINNLYTALTSSATVGNRIMMIRIYDGTNEVTRSAYMGAQAASQTYHYNWFPGAATVVTGTNQSLPIPDLILLPGWYVRVLDSAVIDAAADDMATVFDYTEYDA